MDKSRDINKTELYRDEVSGIVIYKDHYYDGVGLENNDFVEPDFSFFSVDAIKDAMEGEE